MRLAICVGCRKGGNRRLRQPGTWVVECEEFEERSVPMPAGLLLLGLATPRSDSVRTSLAHE